MSQNEELTLKPNKKTLFEDVGYKPHAGQMLLHSSTARFRVLMCGRRWGKSKSAAYEAIAALIIPQQIGWVVAPTYNLAEKVFREIYWGFLKNEKLRSLVKYASLSSMRIELYNGSMVLGKSADNPVSLLGEGLNFLILDEASRIQEDVWNQALRPTLTDKKGWALFISTPKGMNWFYELYKKGQEKENNYESWLFPSVSNPYLDEEEIKNAQETIPSLIFRQEYMAEPVAEEDLFFPWDLVDSCISKQIPKITERSHIPKDQIYLGVDFARLGEDSTVFAICRKKWTSDEIEVIEIFERKHQLLNVAIGVVKWLDSRYNFDRIFLDETGLGAAASDVLREEVGDKVEGMTFTITLKQDIYFNLRLLMEKGRIKIPKNDKLIYQLKDLRYEVKGKSGQLSIHHSDNGHDDYTDAVALAVAFNKFQPAYEPIIRGFGQRI